VAQPLLFRFYLAGISGLVLCLGVHLATFAGLNPPFGSSLLGVLLLVLIAAFVRLRAGGWQDGKDLLTTIPWGLRLLPAVTLLPTIVLFTLTDDRMVDRIDGAYVRHERDGSSTEITREAFEQQRLSLTRRDSALTMFLFCCVLPVLHAGLKREPPADSDLAKYPITTLVGAEAKVWGGLGCLLGSVLLIHLVWMPPFVRPENYTIWRIVIIFSYGGKLGLLVTGVLLSRRLPSAWLALLITFVVSASHSFLEWDYSARGEGLSERVRDALILPPVVYLLLLFYLRSPKARAELVQRENLPAS
jgi:hypothetical protein